MRFLRHRGRRYSRRHTVASTRRRQLYCAICCLTRDNFGAWSAEYMADLFRMMRKNGLPFWEQWHTRNSGRGGRHAALNTLYTVCYDYCVRPRGMPLLKMTVLVLELCNDRPPCASTRCSYLRLPGYLFLTSSVVPDKSLFLPGLQEQASPAQNVLKGR